MSNHDLSPWQQFLTQQGASWEADQLSAFQADQAGAPTQLIPLEHQSLLLVTGADAEKFLQGQTTANMRRLDEGEVLLGAHCDHKGRMHSSFTAAKVIQGDENSIALRIHQSLGPSASAALKKYIVFSKAELALADSWALLSLTGDDAAPALQDLGWQLPTEDQHFVATGSGTLLRHSNNSFELWLPQEHAQNTWLALAPRCHLAVPAEWDLEQIRKGVGQVRAETIGEFIPQMLNFQKLGGISFDKGCYTGQEVVARMHYLGKSKKHTYQASVAAEQAPAPSTPVFGESTTQPVGQVVMAARASEQRVEMLFVCSETAVEQTLSLADPSGPKLRLQSLPYSLD